MPTPDYGWVAMRLCKKVANLHGFGWSRTVQNFRKGRFESKCSLQFDFSWLCVESQIVIFTKVEEEDTKTSESRQFDNLQSEVESE